MAISIDDQIRSGICPAAPTKLPAAGSSYYGDARRAGLTHERAVTRAAKEMGQALASMKRVARRPGRPKLPEGQRRRGPGSVAVKLSADEYSEVKLAAEQRGLSVPDYLMQLHRG